MHSLKTALAIAGLAALATPVAASDELPWIADFDQAVKVAEREGKDLLVDFTGSDWCKWCITLDEEVFVHDEFLSYARDKYVLVALDFPRDEAIKAQVPNPERNDELMREHGVQGFPTILLMTAEGDVYGQTGYQPGGPAKYVAHLTELRETGRPMLMKVIALAEEFAAAEGAARLAVWERVLDMLEGMDATSAGLQRLVEPAKLAFELDPENAAGHKLRAVRALAAVGQLDEDVRAAIREHDPRNEEGLLELALRHQFYSVMDADSALAACDELDALLEAGGFRDTELGFELLATAASWFHVQLAEVEGVDTAARAKRYAGLAKELGGHPGATRMLDSILDS